MKRKNSRIESVVSDSFRISPVQFSGTKELVFQLYLGGSSHLLYRGIYVTLAPPNKVEVLRTWSLRWWKAMCQVYV